MTQGERPNWKPLLDTVGEDVTGDFMWMYEVELEDGSSLQVYKHIDTRRSVHLDAGGSAFCYTGDERYERISLVTVLLAVFRPLHEISVPDDVITRSYAAVDRLLDADASP